MIRIDYTITSGAFPVTVELIGGITLSNIHYSPESGYFDNVPEGDYEITFTDSDGCVASDQLQWCDCPEGYSQTGSNCVKYEEVEATYTATTYTILKKASDNSYSVYGLLIFDSWNYNGTGTFEWINDLNTYWRNAPYPSVTGVMNRTCVWGSTTANNQDIGFSFCINIAATKTYYVGFGCDNWGKIKLNGQFILEQDLTAIKAMFASLGNMSGYNDDGATFKYWYIYPITLTAGQNIIEVFGHNRESVAAVGIQIYDATKQDIINATDINPLGDKILFSSESLVGETLQYEYSMGGGYHGYSCPEGYALDTCGEIIKCVKKTELDCGEEPSTTTTSTTEVVETTTTTTTLTEEQQQLIQCINDAFIFENVLPFDPVATNPYFGQSVIEENADYIFIAFTDTLEGNYKYSTIYRYKKSDGTSTYKRVQVAGTYYYDTHKVPFIFITSTGALLLAVEQLVGNAAHNGAIEIFRWADPSDLNTYTSTVIGNSSTEKLAYPFIYEYDSEIIIDTRKYVTKPPYRTYAKSIDDGISFGTTTLYMNLDDNNYWSYARQVGNSVKGSQPILMHCPLYNTTYNSFQYATFLKTDYINWYALDGTNLGSLVDKTELENASTWGDVSLNTNYYLLQANKIFNGYIYSVGFIGTGNGTGGIVSMQIIRTNISTGATAYGDIFNNVFGSDVEHPDLFNICNSIYIRCINNGIIYYYKVSDDINSIELVYSENTSDFFLQAASSFNELSGIYNASENSIKVYRFSNPDLITPPIITTTTTTTTLDSTTTTTTTEAPTTTTTTTVAPDLLTNLLSVWELDETSGTNAEDSHGTFDGTINGVSVNQVGKIGTSFGFNGTSNYVTMGDVLDFNYNQPFSISVWYYNVASSIRVLVNKLNHASPYNGYTVLFNAYRIQFMLVSTWASNYLIVDSAANYSAAGWHHLVVTYDGTATAAGVKMYMDASPIATTDVAHSLSASTLTTIPFMLGSRNNNAYFWSGRMDQTAVWGKVLTSGEVLALYNSGNGLAYTSW